MRRLAIILWFAVYAVCETHAAAVIELKGATDREYYREGGASEIYVRARVHSSTAEREEESIPVRNVVFVLDRSGSMAGEPMQALRLAMLSALESLADRDVVSVVLFGSEVETLIEAQRRDQMRDMEARIVQIEPAGGAALYDALNQAAAQLRRYAGPSTINQLILVSDGPPTKGPREFDDFVRLAELFSREGTAVSTIGLGDEFDEDLLATLAGIGNGRFSFADSPEKLSDTLLEEIAPGQTAIARDVTLSFEFKDFAENVRSHSREPAVVGDGTIVFQFPHLFADQDLSVLASARVKSFRATGLLTDFVVVRLRWRDVETGEFQELSEGLSIRFTTETRVIRRSANPDVYRAAVGMVIGEGMQNAIAHLDEGDIRRAERTLRQARSQARSLNYDLDDPAIAEDIRRLETYLAEVQARGMNQLDRKILRSGLFNQFELPVEDEDEED